MNKDEINLNDQSFVLKLAIQKRYPERLEQRDSIIFDLLSSFIRENPGSLEDLICNHNNKDESASVIAQEVSLWTLIDDLLYEIDAALYVNPEESSEIKRWRNQEVRNLDLDNDKSIDDSISMEALANIAYKYLSFNWAESPSLEIWLIRQMAYAETFAFARDLVSPLYNKSRISHLWRWLKTIGNLVIGLSLAISISNTHGVALGVITYISWFAFLKIISMGKFDNFTKVSEIYLSMRNVYYLAIRTNPSPVEIEKALSNAESKGAVWPEGMRSLIEKALLRNRVLWKSI